MREVGEGIIPSAFPSFPLHGAQLVEGKRTLKKRGLQGSASGSSRPHTNGVRQPGRPDLA